MFKRFLPLLIVLGSAYGDLSLAQVTTATVRGTVKDPSGAILPGVIITAKQVETGIARTAITDDSGEYRISSLPPGSYEVSAELPGFKRFVRGGITLSIGQEAAIPVTLELGEITEEVVVKGEPPLVDTASSSVSGLVEGNVIRDMPLNGRSFDHLAVLNPGVTRYHLGGQNVQNGLGIKMSISGARPESTYFMLDGTNILDHSNFTPGSAAGNNLGVEAIREFRVFAHNYSAEIGVRGGGAVSVVTRSGTNQFHGSVFEFHRNDNMDARNFFDPGEDPPEFKRNQFGFSLGGPIVRDKTFFFADAEWLRERLGRTLIAVVPNARARLGILPGLAVEVNPVVRPYLDLYPLPNGRDFGDGTAEFIDSFSQPTDESYFMARIDHQFSSNDTLFGRYTFDDATVVTPQADLARFVDTFQSRSQFLTLQETHIFNQNLLNEFRFAFNRTGPKEDATAIPKVDQSLKFFDHALEVGRLDFSPGRGSGEGAAISAVGVGGNSPRVFTQNVFQFTDNLSQKLGRHSLRYGVDFQRIQLNLLSNDNTNGVYSFVGLVNFLRGTPASFGGPAPGSDPIRGYRQSLVGSYIQDDFQFRPNLTFNLGLRHEFTTVPSEENGKMSNLVNVMDPSPKIGFLLEENNSLRNFAPRVGFAWDPWGDGKTAIRGGFGVFYSQVMGRNYYTYTLRQTPFSFNVIDRNPPFPNPFIRGIASVRQQNDRIDPNLKTPTMYHYSLTLQRQLAGSLAFEIGYVGSRGVHLLRNFEGNTAIPQILPDGRPFYPPNSVSRNPNFSSIFVLASDSQSLYNSLQTTISKRYSHSLQLRGTYTFAKSIDDASHLQRGQGRNSPSFTQYPDDRKADRGLSSFHVAHAFTLNFIYDFPRWDSLSGIGGALLNGWQMGGIVNINSGTPFTAETGFNRSRDRALTIADRPNLKPGKSNNPVLGGPDRYFDPTVFELPPAGFYGNVGRNTIIGPGLATTDLSFVKQFRIAEDRSLDFRLEVFNVWNRANFGLPRNRIFNAQGQIPGAVGRITTTVTSSRQIQWGLKFRF